MGDIGHHFPDTDAQFKNIDSRALLRMVYAKLKGKGYSLVNADMTIVAQVPKMAPYIEAMCTNIAADLDTDRSNINVKETTTEKLGFNGAIVPRAAPRRRGDRASATAIATHEMETLQDLFAIFDGALTAGQSAAV